MKFYPVIGLEIHVQLNTKTKLFCRCLNEYTPDYPNKNICPFCTGQPGALPVLNKEAVKKAIQFGVAVNAKIPEKTRWDRKNYFYPDLPAGYQISQYDNPIVEGGYLEFYVEPSKGGEPYKSKINLTRAHLEADAGKSLHTTDKTMVDYNRSGVPLIEIVTEPEISSADQAMSFASELQLLVRTLGISDAEMEKGQMRFDCNISLRSEEEHASGKLPSYKVEVKNINSFRALGRAIEYEIERQSKLLAAGQLPDQETRGWRDDLNKSISQRSKEQAHDYRYFPEPDLQILEIRREDIPSLESLPILPNKKRENYLNQGLNLQTTNTLITQPKLGNLFNQVQKINSDQKIGKVAANIITGNLISLAVKLDKPAHDLLDAQKIAELADIFNQRKINNQGLQKSIEILAENIDKQVQQVLEQENLLQVTDDSALMPIVEKVINENPVPVEQYKSGKVQVIGFLVGQCMKEAKGKGNPSRFKELLEQKLK